MGKSPGKWIKTLLFGKKSSKSNFSKGREKIGNEKPSWVIAKAPEADLCLDPPLASDPSLNAIDKNEEKLDNNRTAYLPLEEGTLVPENRDADTQEITQLNIPNDPERIRQVQAATKAQAAFRGYLARRAFWTLKGIIRLQALVRGHLVRRQAVSTLHCMLGIVKLQAVVRGRKIRQSDNGLIMQTKCTLVKPLVWLMCLTFMGSPLAQILCRCGTFKKIINCKSYMELFSSIRHLFFESRLVDPIGINRSAQIAKLSTNAFICKLIASSPTAMPLHFQYDSAEPNSVLNWLECWSASLFWKPVPQSKKVPGSKFQKKQGNSQAVDTETGRLKHNIRRVPATNVDDISTKTTTEFEKPRRNLKKVSSHPADSVQEHPQNELEKVKRSLRKVHNPIIEGPVQPEVYSEKSNNVMGKELSSSVQDVSEQSLSDSAEKIKETIVTVSKLPDVEATPEPLIVNEAVDLLPNNPTAVELQPSENRGKDECISLTNGELTPKEDLSGNENQKSCRKASPSAKQDRADNGLQSRPTLPSYMAATESAKAKLRGQGSPRFGQDAPEKHNLTRRHSLPSTNSKMSQLSPRAQRPVQASGKGGNRSNKSLLSSTDGNVKIIQAEWKR